MEEVREDGVNKKKDGACKMELSFLTPQFE
jgi:hypothetical protein